MAEHVRHPKQRVRCNAVRRKPGQLTLVRPRHESTVPLAPRRAQVTFPNTGPSGVSDPTRQNLAVTLREVIARLEEFSTDDTIYVESAAPTARAVVATEPDDGAVPRAAAELNYLLGVALAREAIDVWGHWRPGRTPTLDDKVAAVTYYAQNDAWLPVE